MAVLLITTAVILGTFVAGLAGVWRRRAARQAFSHPEFEALAGDSAAPFLFDRPSRWIAIRCSNIQKVQAALGLNNPTPCPLSEGFSRLNEHKLFISLPVKGWILVVGHSIPDVSDDVDKVYHYLMSLASELGSVQYFSSNRALSHHAWVRIENNRVYRAYAWTGETVWNQGERTAAERELELKCYDYGASPMPYPFTARDSHVANTDKVIQLASRWSVDPLAVNNPNFKAAFGIVGDPSRRV